MIKTITNKATGITYFNLSSSDCQNKFANEISESMGKHFFLDKDFQLISASTLTDTVDHNGFPYDADNLDYVEDWECFNELSKIQLEGLFSIIMTLKENVAYKLERNGSRKLINRVLRELGEIE